MTEKFTFYSRPYDDQIHDRYDWQEFKVGNCTGLWCSSNTPRSYNILAFLNKVPGDGSFKFAMEWFESSAKRDRMPLIIHHVMNDVLKKHLITKRGFSKHPTLDEALIKYFI